MNNNITATHLWGRDPRVEKYWFPLIFKLFPGVDIIKYLEYVFDTISILWVVKKGLHKNEEASCKHCLCVIAILR